MFYNLEEISGVLLCDQNIPVSGHMVFCLDISLISSIIDWYPKYKLYDGLKLTYDEMKSFYETQFLCSDLI